VKRLGVLALTFYLVHGAELALDHTPWDLLWLCNVANVLIGLGCLTGLRAVTAVGLSWVLFGVWLWVLDLLSGSPLQVTSILTHLGGPAVGLAALRKVGWPRGTWWRALLAELALLGLTRLATPRAANVNLAFAVWPGWEDTFPSYPAYVALLLGASGAAYFVLEALAGFLAARRERRSCAISSSTR
jgi:hypothetical protein